MLVVFAVCLEVMLWLCCNVAFKEETTWHSFITYNVYSAIVTVVVGLILYFNDVYIMF